MVRRGVENSRCFSKGLAFSDIRCGNTGRGEGEAEGVIRAGLAGDTTEGGSIAFATSIEEDSGN